jgi:hypothetical protein
MHLFIGLAFLAALGLAFLGNAVGMGPYVGLGVSGGFFVGVITGYGAARLIVWR